MRRAIGIAGWCVLAVIAAVHAAALAGVRVNLSPSVPRGVYWLRTRAALQIGEYVAVCPPRTRLFELALERGYLALGGCASGYSELIKVVAAQEGDLVAASAEGVHVGDRLWPFSKPLEQDRAGRSIPQRLLPWSEVLGPASVFVMSDREPSGFDGRYFGVLDRAVIVGSALPIFTW